MYYRVTYCFEDSRKKNIIEETGRRGASSLTHITTVSPIYSIYCMNWRHAFDLR